MEKHFLQGEAWKKFQFALGNEYIENTGDGWAYLAMVQPTRFGKQVYVPYGPTATDEPALSIAQQDLAKKSKFLGAYKIIAEPFSPITYEEAASIFQKEVDFIQPKHTRRILLKNKSKAEIIAAWTANRRNQYRSYQRRGLEIIKSTNPDDWNEFYRLHKIHAETLNYPIHDAHFFKVMAESLVADGQACFYFGKMEGKLALASLNQMTDKVQYYTYFGRDFSFNQNFIHGPFVSEMILDAAENGKEYFDMVGVYPQVDRSHPYYGFTKFKNTFNGELISYAGTWETSFSKTRSFLESLQKLGNKYR